MIQIDMPMPKNCLDCPACNEYLMCAIPIRGRGWGENDVKEFGQSRPEWCPMEDIESYIKIGNSDYQWNDNHGELIRCKDCKHGEPCNNGEIIYCKIDIGTVGTTIHEPDWFCAEGKRK